jgi:hypothetical protein
MSLQVSIKKRKDQGLLFYYLLGVWLLVNFLQSAFTGLLNDEAYYWYYSLKLAWGYYDHPPMIALLIRAGDSLFPGVFGVRFFLVLLSGMVLWLIRELADTENILLFFAFVFSIFIFHADGFVVSPDTVFVFFTALFFYAYKNYLKDDSPGNVLLLIIAVTGMFYSKYFAVLVVVFTIMANITIVKRRSFWLIFLLSVLAMIPHLIWQINHDFVTFYFHLKERNVNTGFGLSTVLEFLGGQFLMMNPLVAWFLITGFLNRKIITDFERVLWLNVAGVFGFAFLISFWKRVEANWTIVAFIPLLLLAYPVMEKKIKKNTKFKKQFYSLVSLSVLLVLVMRLNIAVDLFDLANSGILKQFYGWKERAGKFERLAAGRPVVFSCSYQNASQYIFNTGQPSFTFNYLFYRKNQFDLDSIEPTLLGKEVLFIKNTKILDEHFRKPFEIPDPDSVLIENEWWYFKNIQHYFTYNFLEIKIRLEKDKLPLGTEVRIPVELVNPLDSAVVIAPGGKAWLTVCFAEKNRPYEFSKVEEISGLKLDQSYKTILKVKTPDRAGKYFLWVSVQTDWLSPAINHRVYPVKVE